MPTLERLNTEALRDTVRTFRDTVRAHAGGLNRLNVYPVPDGDTGTNMARTLDAVVEEMDATDPDDLAATCDAISHGSLMGARGNSGVILSQILRGFASTLKDQAADAHGAPKFAEALQAAAAGAYQAVLKPIEGTILTVARETPEGAKAAADEGGSLAEVPRHAVTPASRRSKTNRTKNRTCPECTASAKAHNCKEKRPRTDEEWKEVRRHGIMLLEASNALLMPGRRVARPGEKADEPAVELAPEQIQELIDKDRASWDKYAQELHDATMTTFKAIEAKNADDLLATSDGIDRACENCHMHYWYPNDKPPAATSQKSGY